MRYSGNKGAIGELELNQKRFCFSKVWPNETSRWIIYRHNKCQCEWAEFF